MNITPENRAALRALAVEPIRSAGLDYADPSLVSDMLARMNYYPSLVQVFGRQIVESFGRRPANAGNGPRWLLDRDNLFEGEAAERIAGQIRDRFQLTLNLDLRYECIAKSIALHRIEAVGGDAQVLSQGLGPAEIRNITGWPQRLAQPTLADFEELLNEMVDLGVLGQLGDKRYGLRNAQVAQMLGQHDSLQDDLLGLDDRDDEPAYDAALFHGLLRPQLPHARAPLPDRALQALFDPGQPGLRVVVAQAAVAGPDVARRMQVAAGLWLEGDHKLVTPDEASLRRAIDGTKSAPNVVVIDGPWSNATAALLGRQAKVVDGRVLPAWCLDLCPDDIGTAFLFQAGPWSEPMLRHWLADEGLAPGLDDPETRSALLAASGGAPARLAALRPFLADLVTRPVAERVADLLDWSAKTPLQTARLGLEGPDLVCLGTLRDYDGQFDTAAVFFDFCPAATPGRLQRLNALGLLREGQRPGDAPALTALGRLAVP